MNPEQQQNFINLGIPTTKPPNTYNLADVVGEYSPSRVDDRVNPEQQRPVEPVRVRAHRGGSITSKYYLKKKIEINHIQKPKQVIVEAKGEGNTSKYYLKKI